MSIETGQILRAYIRDFETPPLPLSRKVLVNSIILALLKNADRLKEAWSNHRHFDDAVEKTYTLSQSSVKKLAELMLKTGVEGDPSDFLNRAILIAAEDPHRYYLFKEFRNYLIENESRRLEKANVVVLGVPAADFKRWKEQVGDRTRLHEYLEGVVEAVASRPLAEQNVLLDEILTDERSLHLNSALQEGGKSARYFAIALKPETIAAFARSGQDFKHRTKEIRIFAYLCSIAGDDKLVSDQKQPDAAAPDETGGKAKKKSGKSLGEA